MPFIKARTKKRPEGNRPSLMLTVVACTPRWLGMTAADDLAWRKENAPRILGVDESFLNVCPCGKHFLNTATSVWWWVSGQGHWAFAGVPECVKDLPCTCGAHVFSPRTGRWHFVLGGEPTEKPRCVEERR